MALKDDGQLAAVLAACVAQVLEERAMRSKPNSKSELALTTAAVLLVPMITIPAVVVAEQKDGNRLETDITEQDARVGMTYLAAAGYPVADAPSAWEKLQASHGTPHWNKQPDGRVGREYQAQAENAAATALLDGEPEPSHLVSAATPSLR